MGRFRGLCVPVGTHTSPDGIVYATPDRIKKWVDKFRRMKAQGIKIPLAWGHQPSAIPIEDTDPDAAEAEYQLALARFNAGYLEDLEQDDKGDLYFVAEAPGVEIDPTTGNAVTWTRLPDGREVRSGLGEVSAGINSWRDGKGNLWHDSIVHVALTPLPVCAGQQGFQALSSLRHRHPSRPCACACVGPNCPAGPGKLVGHPLRLGTLSVSPVAVPAGGLRYGRKRLPGGYRLSLWQLGALEERAAAGDRDAEALLVRLGWTKGRSRGGKTVWIGNAEDQGKRRYQESEPGSWTKRRQQKAQFVQGWHGLTDHGEFAKRLQEAHGQVAPEEEAPEASVNRAYATLKKHHYRGGDPLGRLVLRLREKAAEYAHQAQDEEATPTARWLARRKLHGVAQMLRKALEESGAGRREGLLETPGQRGTATGGAAEAAAKLKKKEEPPKPKALPRARMKQAAPGDVLPGGKADALPAGSFSPEAEAKGAAVEREHTSDPKVAAEIARDHLAEDPQYYEKLAEVEGGEEKSSAGSQPYTVREEPSAFANRPPVWRAYGPNGEDLFISADTREEAERQARHATSGSKKLLGDETVATSLPPAAAPIQETPPTGESTNWLQSLPTDQQEATLAAMRAVREQSDRQLERHRQLQPRHGEIATGGEHFDAFLNGEALVELLRHVNRGDSPQEAAEKAKQYAREMVAKWNRNPQAVSLGGGKEQLARWEGAADAAIEDAMRRLVQADPSSTPPPNPELQQDDIPIEMPPTEPTGESYVRTEETAPAAPGASGGLPEPVGGGAAGGSPARNDAGAGGRSAQSRIITVRPDLTPPGDPGLVPASVRPHLNEDQQRGVSLAIDALEKHGGFLLADGTGVGKTRQMLAVARHFLDKGKKVVIVSPSEVIKPNWAKGTMAGSFANDSKALNLPTKLVKGDTTLAPGTAHLTTYNELSKLKDRIDKDTVVLFDESHFMKNRTSARHKHGKDIMGKAGAVLYATATPGDKPLHIAHLARAGVFGNVGSTETYQKLGMELVDQHVGGGQYQKVWRVDPKVGYKESARRLAGLFDQMTRDGLMVKREMSMDRVQMNLDRVTLSPAQQDEIKQVYAKKMRETDGNKAVSLMAARLHQEPFKVPATTEMVKQELAAGRMPVVFLGRVNDITDEDEDDVTSVGTVKALKAALIAAGIPEKDIGELHGGATKTAEQKKRAMEDFQSGKRKVMLATIQSGGTGINLDDVVGDRPRSLILMTPPFTANDMAQALGRVNRLNTKSDVRVRGVLADTAIDDWNANLLEQKFRTLGAVVGGSTMRGVEAIRPEGAPEVEKNAADLSARMGKRLSATVRYRNHTLPAGTRLRPHHLSTLRQRATTGDDDARCLLRLLQPVRLTPSDLPQPSDLSQDARTNGTEPRSARAVRLSTGGTAMAEDNDDLFDDINDDSEGGAGDEDSDADDAGAPETPADSDEDKVKEAIADMAEMGIVIPDSVTSPKDFVEHLCTAIKTHKATKETMGGGAPAPEATAESGAAEESPPMLMSLNRLKEPVARAMAERVEASDRRDLIRRIKRLEKAGLRPKLVSELLKEASGFRLSLNTRTNQLQSNGRLEEKIKVLEQAVPATNLGSLRYAEEVEAPDAEEVKAEERRKKLGREMAGTKDD